MNLAKPDDFRYLHSGELSPKQIEELCTWMPDISYTTSQDKTVELPNLRPIRNPYPERGHSEEEASFWHTMMMEKPTVAFSTFRSRFANAIKLESRSPHSFEPYAHYFITLYLTGGRTICNGSGHLANGGYVVEMINDSRPDRILYYEWGKCIHQYESKNIGRCYNRYTCKHCGNAYEIDSSD